VTASAILTWHSLDTSGSVISTDPFSFRLQLEALHRSRVPVVRLADVASTPGSVALTFDDGYRNFLDHALPLLDLYRFPATVFVISGEWPARSPELELLSWNEVRQLADHGVEIGAHTVSHPNLRKLSDEQLHHELAACRDRIHAETGAVPRSFAYPYGAADARVREAASRYFDRACGTRLRFLRRAADKFELPRLDAYYLRDQHWFEGLLRPGCRSYIAVRRLLRGVRAWGSQ
jgi:peptidoglycan/xylan/chitin deacetylase (PgdA/CDA1 family)